MPYVYMFHQENNSKHNAELNRQWLIWNIPKQPAQSPDFNPIEHLWAIFKRDVNKVSILNRRTKRAVIREWELCRNLANSMHR